MLLSILSRLMNFLMVSIQLKKKISELEDICIETFKTEGGKKEEGEKMTGGKIE